MAPPTVLQNRTSDMTNTDIDREMPDHFHDHVTSDRTCMQDHDLMQAFVQASGRSAAFVSPPDHLIELINSGFMNTVTTSHFMGLLPRYSHAPHQICPLKLRGGGRDDDTRDACIRRRLKRRCTKTTLCVITLSLRWSTRSKGRWQTVRTDLV